MTSETLQSKTKHSDFLALTLLLGRLTCQGSVCLWKSQHDPCNSDANSFPAHPSFSQPWPEREMSCNQPCPRGWGGVKEERTPSREQTALGAGRWESTEGPNLASPSSPARPREGTVGLCCHLEGGGSTAATDRDSPWGTSRSALLSLSVPCPGASLQQLLPRNGLGEDLPF